LQDVVSATFPNNNSVLHSCMQHVTQATDQSKPDF